MESFLSIIQYMNYAGAGMFVAFSINVRLCVTLLRPRMKYYVGVVIVCTSVSFRSAD